MIMTKERIAMVAQYPNLCRFWKFSILFHDEYIYLFIIYWSIWAEIEKCEFITDINMYIEHNSENSMC